MSNKRYLMITAAAVALGFAGAAQAAPSSAAHMTGGHLILAADDGGAVTDSAKGQGATTPDTGDQPAMGAGSMQGSGDTADDAGAVTDSAQSKGATVPDTGTDTPQGSMETPGTADTMDDGGAVTDSAQGKGATVPDAGTDTPE